MTLCIAALCRDYRNAKPTPENPFSGTERVILSYDSRIETGEFSAETERKIEGLGNEWSALISGNDIYHAREITGAVREHLDTIGAGAITLDNAAVMLEPAVDKVRRRLDERYVQREYAMALEDFEDFGEAKFGRQEVDRARYDMRAQRVDADVIIIAYIAPSFGLYRYSGYHHRIVRERNFAVVGSGATIALANLYQREYRANMDLRTAIYVVYESARLGQKAPGVGADMTLLVFRPKPDDPEKAQWAIISPMEPLEGAFGELGPQRIDEERLAKYDFSV